MTGNEIPYEGANNMERSRNNNTADHPSGKLIVEGFINNLLIFPLLAIIAVTGVGAQEVKIAAAADRQTALYTVGEKVIFSITLTGVPHMDLPGKYSLTEGGQPPTLREYILSASKPAVAIEYEFKRPGFVLLNVFPSDSGLPVLQAGAGCEPEKLRPSQPKPDDFDTFWDSQKARLDAIPANEIMIPLQEVTSDSIETYAITFDNINGSKIRGYYSKPKGNGLFPAILFVNWAGIYSLNPANVTAYAKRGVIALDINPHDIENGQSIDYYKELGTGRLLGWQLQGRSNRESSYYLRMFLSCYRAGKYLTGRPEWDKKRFVVTGGSMGGGQSFITAYLCPQITALAAAVPALCDHGGMLVDRIPGWPQWISQVADKPEEKQLAASRYFDCVNFAQTIRARALVSVGFIDTLCSPSSVYTAFNALVGAKRMHNMPTAGHKGDSNWRAELKTFLYSELGIQN